MSSNEVVDILVVEDKASEHASIVEVLQSSIQNVMVVAVSNGTEALNFLFSRGIWSNRVEEAPPKLILMDLILPGSDGFSILGQIRSLEPENALTLTPVVVFSDSQKNHDIQKCYRCGANSYIIKPLSYPDFQLVVKSIGQYWMEHNRT